MANCVLWKSIIILQTYCCFRLHVFLQKAQTHFLPTRIPKIPPPQLWLASIPISSLLLVNCLWIRIISQSQLRTRDLMGWGKCSTSHRGSSSRRGGVCKSGFFVTFRNLCVKHFCYTELLTVSIKQFHFHQLNHFSYGK